MMRVSILGLALLAVMVSAAALAQTKEETDALTDGLVRDVKVLSDRISIQPALVQDWLRNSEIATGTKYSGSLIKKSVEELSKQISKEQLNNITEELESKTITDLNVIKIALDDDSVCSVLDCFGVQSATVKRIADAVISGRDKEETVRAANINTRIAISGAVLAVLSFLMSAWSTITSLRSKKPGLAPINPGA